MSKLTSYRLLSFDVYGTLIEWEKGLLSAFTPLLESNSVVLDQGTLTTSRLLSVYHAHEHAEQVAHPTRPYREILAAIHPRIAQDLGLQVIPTATDSAAFGASIGSWPAFPDTVAALRRLQRHFLLVVLSNVDRDSFGRTLSGPLAGVRFDKVITAQDVGSYKPDLRNFEYMLAEVRREFGVEKGQVLQTAHSQTHDCVPAREMGIKSVWIVRSGGVIGVGGGREEVWDWKFETLGDMADALERELDEEEKGKK